MKKLLRKSAGFTLIELIIYMGIFSMILLILLQLFGVVLDVLNESQSDSMVFEDANYISARINFDIKNASDLTLPLNPGETNQELKLTINGQEYVYRITDNNLTLSDGSGTYNLNSYDTTISNLNFKTYGYPNGKKGVIATFTLTSKTLFRGKPEIRNVRLVSGLR